jgi:ABC-type methionine transport system permease subunit
LVSTKRKHRIALPFIGGNHSFSKNMEKTLNLIKAFIPSILFIILGIYILKITDSILGTLIGISNIAFFGILIIWATFKIYKNSHSNAE